MAKQTAEQKSEGKKLAEAKKAQAIFAKRAEKAFKGKDNRTVVNAINNQFPDRTGELMIKIDLVKKGKLMDEKILEAVEAL